LLARGVVTIHSAPSHLQRQIAWSVSRTLRYEVMPIWAKQPALAASVATRFEWLGDESTGAHLASLLAGWQHLIFEVEAADSAGAPQSVWLFAPGLGVRHRALDSSGNYTITDFELKAALESSGGDPKLLTREMQNLLAEPWEAVIEPLRPVTEALELELKRRTG
jgi:Protein of unknown function (DUF3145)